MNRHRRELTKADVAAIATVGAAAERDDLFQEVVLPAGVSPFQGFSNRCAAEAVRNVAESCRMKHGERYFPDVDSKAIYDLARSIDGLGPTAPGTLLTAAAEAYCRLSGRGTKWVELPLDAQFFARWLASERVGIALGMRWGPTDQTPGFSRVLERSNGAIGGHAIHLRGYRRWHEWRRYPWFGKRRFADVFIVENSNTQFPELAFYLPFSRIQTCAWSAVALVTPDF